VATGPNIFQMLLVDEKQENMFSYLTLVGAVQAVVKANSESNGNGQTSILPHLAPKPPNRF